MSDSQVIARKFRPQTFDQMVGQEAIRRTIENSIKSGRIHHAYLFSGARGVGKTTTARILAKALNCIKGPTVDPCGVCASCVEIAASRSIDVMEIDAASNTGVDNVRDVIINSVQISPARDRNKIFIIDEVHMLSNAAFNALLKTLEEPPPRVVFIMATTELHKVPETILSRCQVFEFRTITLKKVFDHLREIANAEKITISDKALLSIARAGEGSMRDAQSALDQVISFAGSTVKDEDVSIALGLVDIETLNDTMQAIGDQDAQKLLRLMDDIVTRGYDLRNFSRELMTHIRGLLVVKVTGFDAELVQMPASEGETLTRLAELFSEQDLLRFFSILTKTEQDIRVSSQPRFQLEMGLMKMLQSRRLFLLEDALKQLEEISARFGIAGLSGASPAASGKNFGSSPSSRPTTPGKSTLSNSRTPTAFANVASPLAQAGNQISAASPHHAIEEGAPPAPTAPSNFAPVVSKASTKPNKPKAPQSPPWEDAPAMFNESPDSEPEAPSQTLAEDSNANEQGTITRFKQMLEEKKKMMLLSVINLAESTRIIGDTLEIVYEPSKGIYKNQVTSRDNKKLIEEICHDILGRQIKLLVTVGESVPTNEVEANPKPKAATGSKQSADDHPKLRAIADKFKGQIVDIIAPENKS
jgi:DNA polymerase-3 subunit gamma/tau